MVDVPSGSIYFWMYTQGLKHVMLQDILNALEHAGKPVREKDVENYWNGWHNSDLYHGDGKEDMFKLTRRKQTWTQGFFDTPYAMYPEHPYMGVPCMPEVQNRWVPCNKNNKPMIKWSNGCMSLADAKAMPNQVYLAENVKGCKFIVIDCDGDHGDGLDMETILFLRRYKDMTHMLSKPKSVCEYKGYEHTCDDEAASFHLTFLTTRLIPTMHFPYAGIDIVGNRHNSLRYLKNKEWNHIQPAYMTADIWQELQDYIKYRKEKADATRA